MRAVGPPGDQAHHHFLRYAKGGRAFASIQNAKAPAGAGANVDQPPAGAERRGDGIHGLRDLGQHALHGFGHDVVFLVHPPARFQRG